MSKHYDEMLRIVNLRVDAKIDSRIVAEMQRRYELEIAANRDALAAALHATEVAISKSENAVEKRFDAVNEFREQLRDQNSTMMPRTEAETFNHQTTDRINGILNRLNTDEGRRTGVSTSYTALITGIPVLVGIATVVTLIFTR